MCTYAKIYCNLKIKPNYEKLNNYIVVFKKIVLQFKLVETELSVE